MWSPEYSYFIDFIYFYVKNKNVVFSALSGFEKVKNDFICDKNVTKKLMHMYKNVTKFFTSSAYII